MEVWYVAEGSTRPELVDAESSRNWVYIRKDVHTETREDEVTGESYTVYVWLEMKIPKDVYPVYEQEMQNSARLADVEEVITEIIGGGLI